MSICQEQQDYSDKSAMGNGRSRMGLIGYASIVALITCLTMLPREAPGVDSRGAGGTEPVHSETARRVYLLRHGEAAYYAADGTEVADTDSVGLTERGVAQARELAQWFRAQGLTHFDRLLVSPLPRAQQTARLLIEYMELSPSNLQTVEALRELPAGEGATVEAARAAALAELERLRRAGDWEAVLVVAHGGIHRSLLARALTGRDGVPVRAALDNACLHLLELRPDGEWLVRGTNLCTDGPVTQGPARGPTLAAPGGR
jgi:broad specificity phosphatase PhoE